MRTVREILQSKGPVVWTISPEATVYEALKMMAEKDLGALLVTRGTEILGIISERDYARKVVLKGKFSRDVPVSEIMTSRVLYVGPSQTTDECMALMIDKRVRHLPVVENECLVGFISVGDVVKSVIDEKQLLITELENYITGRR